MILLREMFNFEGKDKSLSVGDAIPLRGIYHVMRKHGWGHGEKRRLRLPFCPVPHSRGWQRRPYSTEGIFGVAWPWVMRRTPSPYGQQQLMRGSDESNLTAPITMRDGQMFSREQTGIYFADANAVS